MYPLPEVPEGSELVGFEIQRGFPWWIVYWAWCLFGWHVQMPFTGYVIRLKGFHRYHHYYVSNAKE